MNNHGQSRRFGGMDPLLRVHFGRLFTAFKEAAFDPNRKSSAVQDKARGRGIERHGSTVNHCSESMEPEYNFHKFNSVRKTAIVFIE